MLRVYAAAWLNGARLCPARRDQPQRGRHSDAFFGRRMLRLVLRTQPRSRFGRVARGKWFEFDQTINIITTKFMFVSRCLFSGRFLFALSVATMIGMIVLPSRADYPLVSQRYAADPGAFEFNGRIYIYCSNDDDNGTNNYIMHSITCFSSDDLKNWTDHGIVLNVPANATWAGLSWAPAAVSNNNLVYLYFANGASGIGVATSSVPTGPFKDARGAALVNSSTPGASTPNQWLFDPSVLLDDNGTPYLYFGGQFPTNARVIQLGANLASVVGSAMPMFATNFFEDSWIHKRNGIYYYTYCNSFSVGAAIYCETNSNPTNGFLPEGTVMANPPSNVNNNNHHAIFSYQGNWYIAYHNRYVALQNGLSAAAAVYKRSICLDRLNFNANGTIQQVVFTTDGLPQLKNLNPYTRVEAETIARESGIQTEVCAEGGLDVGFITNNCWTRVRGVDFGSGAATFYARVASAGGGGNIELHLDSLAGTLVGTCAVSPTGGWQTWTTAACSVSGATGVHDLYLKFTGGAGNLFSFNWWQFQQGTPLQIINSSYDPVTPAIALIWNSTPPAGAQSYSVQMKNSLSDADWVTVATGIPSGGSTTTNSVAAGGDAAFYRISSP
jgi:arabinoxylan arabinofuranohydrolase